MRKTFNPQEIINERAEAGRGSFLVLADLKAEWISSLARRNARALTPTERESLEQILTKLARIVVGKKFDLDSWQDIAGYATLVVDNSTGCER